MEITYTCPMRIIAVSMRELQAGHPLPEPGADTNNPDWKTAVEAMLLQNRNAILGHLNHKRLDGSYCEFRMRTKVSEIGVAVYGDTLRLTVTFAVDEGYTPEQERFRYYAAALLTVLFHCHQDDLKGKHEGVPFAVSIHPAIHYYSGKNKQPRYLFKFLKIVRNFLTLPEDEEWAWENRPVCTPPPDCSGFPIHSPRSESDDKLPF